jgi:hypothetical protein
MTSLPQALRSHSVSFRRDLSAFGIFLRREQAKTLYQPPSNENRLFNRSSARRFWPGASQISQQDDQHEHSAFQERLSHRVDCHHAEIFVIQDVTMIDGSAGEILKRDPNPHTFAHWAH